MKSSIRPSKLEDLKFLSENLRPEDAKEVIAQSGSSPKGALLYSYFMSKPCLTTISRHGVPMSIGGVVPEGEGVGRIWLLGCQAMFEDNLKIVRKNRKRRSRGQPISRTSIRAAMS